VTPGGRHQASIDLADAILGSPRPADGIAAAWFRSRRYIGAKDRKVIHERVYAILRRRARLTWWLEKEGAKPDARALLLAELAFAEQPVPEKLALDFDGPPHHPDELSRAERRLVAVLGRAALESPEMPDWVRLEYPEWLDGPLRAALGEGLESEMAALLRPASLDLRVNRLKADRAQALAALAEEGTAAQETPLSPVGLRLASRINLMVTRAFKEGLVEIQDEGSQIAALLVGAKPGMAVIDLCAGAGGKTLALAAQMANKGRLVAADVSEGRLFRSGDRLRRAGIDNVERRVIGQAGDKWLKRSAGRFDRVLVDAPCTGTGTWRRNPDAKWKLTPTDLAELAAKQAAILDRAAKLVRPGGRLIYVTCSLLAEENEAQIESFRARFADFAPLPIERVWAEALPGVACPGKGPWLRLSPARHGTDGFFIALLERAQSPE